MDQTAEKISAEATHLGAAAASKIDTAWDKTGDVLSSAAETIDENAERLPGAAERLARSTATKLATAAKYVRQHDARDVLRDLEDLVKRYPLQSLAAGAVAGFLLALATRDED